MARTAEPSSATPRPLQVASVVDHVYVAIRERILDGALAPDARVHQDLAAAFGVSRTPVPEALRRLAAEGLGGNAHQPRRACGRRVGE
jgi:DNA-binding GntR family transcriptional regulator